MHTLIMAEQYVITHTFCAMPAIGTRARLSKFIDYLQSGTAGCPPFGCVSREIMLFFFTREMRILYFYFVYKST